ncbi:hypothetical protein CSA_018803, partial [Cucumis sativus]
VQPCGELDFDDKFDLVSEYMPKFSEEFLGDVSLLLGDGDYRGKEMENTLQPYCDNKLDLGSSQNYCGEMAMVGLDAMQRANSTLEDFHIWFRPVDGLGWVGSVLPCCPLFVP